MTQKTLLLFDERMIDHDPGRHHPESPARLRAIARAVTDAAPAHIDKRKPHPAQRRWIEAVHAPTYIDRLDDLREKSANLDADTTISPGSIDAAYLAAGCAIDAVTALADGTHRRAFALVRPPGHHAERDHAMGFCLLNNIAIAAEHARRELGFKRVMIIDWDVHHGNGTQHSFYDRRDVLFFSTHLFPFYPGTGAVEEVGRGDGLGYNVNVPLPSGMGDGDYALAFQKILLPIAAEFEPDLVLVSAGFDAHQDDPLGGMNLTEQGFAHLCGLCAQIADRHARGRLALILEGGYDVDALAASALACIDVLGGAMPCDPPPPSARGINAVDSARRMHERYWTL
ncbi:MAG: histone deacetylase [Bradymonadaceae bacterium]